MGATEAQSRGYVNKWLAIANPCSGQYRSSGFDNKWMPELRKYVDSVALTDGPGAATEIAAESTEFDGFVVVGGDGAIFEVINGMQRERQHLAVIPTGRGNCLARDLGIKTVADGIRALQAENSKCVDLMQANTDFVDGGQGIQMSASTIALGYVVSVVDRADKMPAAGPYGYALATLLTRPKAFRCRLGVADGDTIDRSCTGIVINNTVHLANFPAFNDARLRDGLLDLLILKVGWSRQTLHNLSILSGLEFFDPGERSQATGVGLSLDSPQTLMIDGQLYPDIVSLSVKTAPAALWCRHNALT